MVAAPRDDYPGIEFLGVRFAKLDLDQAISWGRASMAAPSFRYVVTPNVDHVVRLHRRGDAPWHRAFVAAEAEADLCLNDSRILAKLARRSGLVLPVVPGSDLTRVLLETPLSPTLRIALIGGSDTDLTWLQGRQPGAEVRQFQPPMGVLRSVASQQAIVDFVEELRPQLTLFAIGAPQSEIVAHQLQQRGRTGGVGLCIGASIEFLTGAKRRAPRVMQQVGLEWAFRLISEPRRLWRRYLVEGPPIFAIWWRWHQAHGANAT